MLLAIASQSALASGKKEQGTWIVPTHIQLDPIMIPVEGRRTAPVTVYLKPTDKKFAGNICAYVPQLRDAFFKIMSRNPVPVKRSKLVLKNVPRQVLASMNKAIRDKARGRRQIKKIYIFAGARQIGKGDVSKLRHAKIDGCQNILRAETARIKAQFATK